MRTLVKFRAVLSRGLVVVTLSAGVAACAHGRSERPPDRPRETGPAATGSTEGASGAGVSAAEAPAAEAPPREIDEDRALAFDAGAGTAQRRASLRVVEEGKGFLIAGRPREAAQRFTRATQIDPTNGFAYYWLGRARIAAHDARGAVGVLQKAESLLGPYPEWREQAAQLLASLGAR